MQSAEVNRTEEMVEYQEGSIVSKTLVDKATGSITLFAFAAGQSLSEHTAPYEALVQVLDGRAEIIIAGQSYELETGESIVMPADVPHAVKAEERFKMMLTMIKD